METNQSVKFELYLHPQQNDGRIDGLDLKKYLDKSGLIDRCLGLEDETDSFSRRAGKFVTRQAPLVLGGFVL